MQVEGLEGVNIVYYKHTYYTACISYDHNKEFDYSK